MILCLADTKFQPFMFPVLGFAFANVSNIQLTVILYDFCVLLACFGY
jgi:hypothetical protein